MNRYHVNSKSGEAGICYAHKGNCPFGDSDQHFDSAEDARAAFEAQVKAFEAYKKTPVGRIDAAADKAIYALKRGIKRSVNFLNDHPGWLVGGVAVVGAIAGVIIAKNIHSAVTADLTSQPFDAKVLDSERTARIIGIIGKGGSVRVDNSYEMANAAGEVFTYRDSGLSSSFKVGETVPMHLYSTGSVEMMSAADSIAPGSFWSQAIGGIAGGATGAFTAVAANMGIYNLAYYLENKWNLRHEKHFGLTEWRSRA